MNDVTQEKKPLDFTKPLREVSFFKNVNIYSNVSQNKDYPYVGEIEGIDGLLQWNEYGEERYGTFNIENTPPKESFHVHINEDGVCVNQKGLTAKFEESDNAKLMVYCSPEDKTIHIRVMHGYSVTLVDENDNVLYSPAKRNSDSDKIRDMLLNNEKSNDYVETNLVGSFLKGLNGNNIGGVDE